MEPVAPVWPVVPVELVLPTWFWSLGEVVVVVVVVCVPSGLVWVCDMLELLLEFAEFWSCDVVCAAATPKASSKVAAVIPSVRMLFISSHYSADSQNYFV
ncbi:MAG: hypothetical protein ACXVZX_15000 [Terriglobales bacterium]